MKNGKDSGLALLKRAINRAGNRTRLAVGLGVTENAIIKWEARKHVPAGWRRVLEMEEQR